MNSYEVMFIVKPDLSEEERKTLFGQLGDMVTKNAGTITNSLVWSERRKLYFKLGKYHEGVYYLLNFSLDPQAIKELRQLYKLNENVLRTLFTRVG
jgi:small subunit ribosomal protein S6